MIKVNLAKAKDIAHRIRRNDRDGKMKPLDLEAGIPYLSEEAEAKRQAIRDANAEVQTSIDAASTEDTLKEVLKSAGMV